MKKSVTVSVDSEKLSALEMYLGQKNMKLSEELEKFAEQLYQKYVPSICVVNRCDPLDEKMPEIRYNVL